MTATVTPAPRVVVHASGALIFTGPHCLAAQASFVQVALPARHAESL
jgi:hypothetical protein